MLCHCFVLVASAHTHLPFQSFPSGKSPYAAPKGTNPSDGQLHTIVKTVYALTHAGFVERILRLVSLDSAASAWEGEWASDDCGKMWRDMASGTRIEMLARFVRGSAIPSGGGDVGSHVLGYQSKAGTQLHFKKGCSSATEKVDGGAAQPS